MASKLLDTNAVIALTNADPAMLRIAALARQYRLPLVSKDTHFDEVDGLTREAW